MSDQFQGNSPEQMRQLAGHIQQTSEQLTQIGTGLGSAVDSVAWMGPDADAFKTQWWPEFQGQLNALSSQLNDKSTDVNRQAEEQETTSAS